MTSFSNEAISIHSTKQLVVFVETIPNGYHSTPNNEGLSLLKPV